MARRAHICDVPGCGRQRKRGQRLCDPCFRATPPAIRAPLLGAWADKRKADYRGWLKRAAAAINARAAARTVDVYAAIARLTGEADA